MRSSRDRNDQADEARGPGFAIPIPGKRTDEILFASATLPAAKAWVVSDIEVDVAKTRRVHCYIKYTAAALGGQWSIIPEVHGGIRGTGTGSGTYPSVWIPLSRMELSSGLTNAISTVPASALYTGENFDKATITPIVVQGTVAVSASEQQAVVVSFDVEAGQLFRLQLSDRGATPGTLEVRFTKSV